MIFTQATAVVQNLLRPILSSEIQGDQRKVHLFKSEF